MISFEKRNNADASVINLLKSLSITIDPAIVAAELEKHPNYPSLLSISDILTNFNIDNSAFRIQPNELTTIPCPFIAHTNSNNKNFVLVHEIRDIDIIISSEEWNKRKISLEKFERMFDGIILTAKPSINISHHKNLVQALVGLRTPFAMAGLMLILLAELVFHTNFFIHLSWQITLLTFVKSAGVIISILLLVQSVDSDNLVVQKVCQSVGKTNCNAILSSKAAKVFDFITWSEVGFFYFASTWLILVFTNRSESLLQALAVLNIISLPYTFYSIYYQARVAKQWCALCCTIQVLLWVEFIPLLSALKQPIIVPSTVELSSFFIAFLLPIILWVTAKPLFLKVQQLRPLKEELRKFKYDTELFDKILKERPKYVVPDENWSIVLGNPKANNCITMVTNPYCPPCAKTHNLLDELLDKNPNLQARIIFTANNNDQDIKTPVSRHMMALNELADKNILRHAMDEWYKEEHKNYEAWSKLYPVTFDEKVFYKLDKQKAWCNMAEIKSTPTLLLNGHELPPQYQLTDLKYMLE